MLELGCENETVGKNGLRSDTQIPTRLNKPLKSYQTDTFRQAVFGREEELSLFENARGNVSIFYDFKNYSSNVLFYWDSNLLRE